MLSRFLLDENINGAIERGLRRRFPDLDVVRAQDTEIVSQDDDRLIAYACAQARMLLSHDYKTVPPAWAERVIANRPVCGVIMIRDRAPIGSVLEKLAEIIESTDDSDIHEVLTYLKA